MKNTVRSAGYALITGASSGIGLELSRICAREGYDLVLTARRESVLRDLAERLTREQVSARGAERGGERGAEHPFQCLVIPADLSEPGSAARILSTLRDREIAPELLINNAGFGLKGAFVETPLERELDMIQVNVTSLVELTKGILLGMVERRRGRVLNVASTAAFQPGPLMAVYYATKAFVLSFSEAIADEVEETGVTVTALCPGPTRSGFQEVAGVTESKLVRMRRIPSSETVARYGYRAMMRGDRVAVEGFLNRFVALAVRFFPRKTVTAAVRKLHMS